MNVSLDTDITIHLYSAGSEYLLYKYFDKLYVHEFILEREIYAVSEEVKNPTKKIRTIITAKVIMSKISKLIILPPLYACVYIFSCAQFCVPGFF